jgi:hypothetical protein
MGQIEFFSDYTDKPLSDERFRKLCQAFDLPELSLSHTQRQYILGDRDMLLRTIQNALRGRPVPLLTPQVAIVNPAPGEGIVIIIAGFLGQLFKMYNRELGEHNSVSAEIHELLSDGIPGKFSAVVLASHGKDRHHIGCACLLHRKEQPEELEVRYLWVVEQFRLLGVGGHILSRANLFARESATSTLRSRCYPSFLKLPTTL